MHTTQTSYNYLQIYFINFLIINTGHIKRAIIETNVNSTILNLNQHFIQPLGSTIVSTTKQTKHIMKYIRKQ